MANAVHGKLDESETRMSHDECHPPVKPSLDGEYPTKVGRNQKPANNGPNTKTDGIEEKEHRLLDIVLIERYRVRHDSSNDL